MLPIEDPPSKQAFNSAYCKRMVACEVDLLRSINFQLIVFHPYDDLCS